MKKEDKHLYNLDELSDYKVSSNDSDVRGWEVRDSDNRIFGKVETLLVNKELKRVVYLDVEVDKTIIDAKHDPYGRPANMDIREFVNKDGENHVIVPIGMADLDDENKYVNVTGIDHRTFAETKRYKKGQNLNREYEEVVLRSYNRDYIPRESETYIKDDIRREPDFKSDKMLDPENDKLADADLKIRRQERIEYDREDLTETEKEKLRRERIAYDKDHLKNKTLNEELDRLNRDSEIERDNLPPISDYEKDDSFYNRDEFDRERYRRRHDL